MRVWKVIKSKVAAIQENTEFSTEAPFAYLQSICDDSEIEKVASIATFDIEIEEVLEEDKKGEHNYYRVK